MSCVSTSSKSRLLLQNFLNPGYPPRFQRSQTVLGNSRDFRRQGFWATSSLQVWNVSSQLQGVAGCCWPQWPPWDVSYANKFVPVPGKDAFFLYKRSQSTDAGPKTRCRYLQDRLRVRASSMRIFQILTSRHDREVSRRLPSSLLAPSLFLFDKERPSMRVLEIYHGVRQVQSECY